VALKSPSSPYGRSWPLNDIDVAVTMHRLIENDVLRMRRNEGESANARGMPKVLAKKDRNKKGVSFVKRHIEQIEFDTTHSLFFYSLVSPPPLV